MGGVADWVDAENRHCILMPEWVKGPEFATSIK